jgi:hypothetical protein
MSETLRKMAKEHHAFYEVLPYYVALEEWQGGAPVNSRRIQAGFDVNIYGSEPDKLTPPPDYAVGYAAAREIAHTISPDTSDSCLIEVIPVPATIVLDTRNHLQPEGMLRIRISHCRGLDKPADLPEQQALAKLEKQLQSLGLARR